MGGADDATVEFIGAGGKILQRGAPREGGVASYRLQGGEGYVRVRVTLANGKRAWTEPSRLAI